MTIEGIPEGWELVRIGNVRHGEFYIDAKGWPTKWSSAVTSDFANYAIVSKIEKPKQYRPFANAAEFEPHRDRWLMHPNEPDKRFKPGDYNNLGVWGTDRRFYDYAQLFKSGTLFEDGTPFGVEVIE